MNLSCMKSVRKDIKLANAKAMNYIEHKTTPVPTTVHTYTCTSIYTCINNAYINKHLPFLA